MFSIVLWGLATELVHTPGSVRARWLFPLRIRIRPAAIRHTFATGGRLVTLVLTSPRRRENRIYVGGPDSDETLTTEQVRV
ncbi:hypothetical protein [Candidatus Poriferisocius sp.]|uniref:hypothetical protein n=1 Tax=Candidatus Poriferisocius sp. TaxID=3101276 RepID=UPI003B0217F7